MTKDLNRRKVSERGVIMLAEVQRCKEIIRQKTDFVPKVALVLGSGLGGYADHMENIVCEIPYSELPGFPVSTVSGHAGRFILGCIGGVHVICMKGRVHYYEGYTTSQVVMPARVMHALGAEILFLTNAAGGIKSTYKAGTLAMLTDHVSLFVPNPLVGPNDGEEGVRFPDMSEVYDQSLQKILQTAAGREKIDLQTGVYAQLTGPSFETPAEIRLLKGLGVDLVGMSTVMEAIAARHMGMRVCGISLVTNLAAGISAKPLSHEEVREAGDAAEPVFTRLVTAAITDMGQAVL